MTENYLKVLCWEASSENIKPFKSLHYKYYTTALNINYDPDNRQICLTLFTSLLSQFTTLDNAHA